MAYTVLDEIVKFLSTISPDHVCDWRSCAQENEILQLAVEYLDQRQLEQLESYIFNLHYGDTLSKHAEIGGFDASLQLPRARQK